MKRAGIRAKNGVKTKVGKKKTMERKISGKSKAGKIEVENGMKAKISRSRQNKAGRKTKNGKKTKIGTKVDTRVNRAMNGEVESKAIQKYANQQRLS